MLIAERNCAVTGVTCSTAQADYCRQLGLEVLWRDLDRDTEEIPGEYDLIFSLEMISHIRNKALYRFQTGRIFYANSPSYNLLLLLRKDYLFCHQSECYGPPSPSISLESIKSLVTNSNICAGCELMRRV